MSAYKPELLDQLNTEESVNAAFEQELITKVEHDVIRARFPKGFYAPNFFIRIGLFLLTLFILLFSFGLLALLFMGLIESIISGLTIFFSFLTFAALEYMIRVKQHFRSGVDDALLWGASISMCAGIIIPAGYGMLTLCTVIFIISLWGAIRYLDRMMAVVAYLSLLGIVFYIFAEAGSMLKALLPFMVMGISLVAYFISKKISAQINSFDEGDKRSSHIHFSGSLEIIEITSLLTLYVAGNYYIVRELTNYMFNVNLSPADPIPLGWLFWLFTILIPLIYLLRGIQMKDMILIRLGLILVAAIVCTIKYYHFILPAEGLMITGGIFLIAIAYGLIKYLKQPKHGFTSQELNTGQGKINSQLESLILSETFTPGNIPENTGFGGGSFGGGGATGNF